MSTLTTLGMNILSRYDPAGMMAADRDMARTGTAAAKLGRAMKTGLLVGTAAMVVVGVEAVKSASKFQASMLKISTQAGGTTKDVGTLTKSVLKLAPSTQQGPEALSEALYHLKSVGMDNVTAMKALKTASDLAAVGGADLESTTNALAGAWRTGIKGAQNFGQTAATVNAIIGAGNMTMEDFTAALGTGILPSAKTFGLSMSQVGAALALFTDEGVPAQAAATRLRMSISLLAAPSKAADAALGDIGVSGLDLANAMRGKDGIIGAIGLLKQHLDDSGLSASKQAILLSHAFGGGRSSSAILSMINNFDVLKKKQDQVNSSLGKYAPAVANQRKTAQAQLKLLESSWETLMIQIGDSGLLAVATKSLQGITTMLGGLSDFVNSDVIPAFQTLTGVMGKLIPVQQIQTGLGQLKKMFSDFISGLGLDSIWKGLTKPALTPMHDTPNGSSGLSKSPYGNAAVSTVPKTATKGLSKSPYGNAAIGKAPKSAAQGLSKSPYGNSGISQVAKSSTQGLAKSPYGNAAAAKTAKSAPPKAPSQSKVIADNIMGMLANLDSGKVGALLGKILSKAMVFAFKAIGDFGKIILNFVKNTDWINVGDSVGKTLFPMAIGMLNGLVEGIINPDMWKKHWLEILIAIASLIPIGRAAGLLAKVFGKIPFIGKIIGPLLKLLEKAGGQVEKLFGKIFGGIGRGIASGLKKEFPEVNKAVDMFFSDIGTFFKTQWGHVTGFLKEGGGLDKFSEWITRGLIKGAKGLGGLIKKWTIDPLEKPFSEIGGWFKGRASEVLSGFKAGLTAAAKGIGGWVKTRVAEPWLSLFEKANSWLKSTGSKVLSGFRAGITGAAKGIGSWVKTRVAQPWLSLFEKSTAWLKSTGGRVLSGFKTGLTGAAKGIGNWVKTKVATPWLNLFAKATSWLKAAGGYIIDGFKSGIVKKITGIGKWVKTYIGDPIVKAVKGFFGIHSPSTVFHGFGEHMITGLMNGLATTDGNSIIKKIFGSMPKALGQLVKKGMLHIENLPKKAMSALSGLGGWFAGLFGGGGSGNGGGGVQRWKPYVQAILQLLGQPLSWTDTVLRRMNQESGGNPNAINNWDINAKNGDPSRGLMQTIGSTFNAYSGPYKSRGIYDPFANIYAGLNYALHTYGSLSALNRPGGYALGTPGAQAGWHWVGENGPELRYTRGGDKVIPNHRAVGMSGATEVHLHFEGSSFNGTSKKEFQNLVVVALRDAEKAARIKKGTVNR